MKPRVKDAYPIFLSVVVKRLRAAGWPPRQLWKQAKSLTPDYVSKNGRVKRFALEWKAPQAPPKPTPVYFIIGTNAATLKIVKSSDKFAPRYSGTKAECEAVMQKAISQWFTLPVGREIEHIVGAKMEMLEEAKPTQPQP